MTLANLPVRIFRRIFLPHTIVFFGKLAGANCSRQKDCLVTINADDLKNLQESILDFPWPKDSDAAARLATGHMLYGLQKNDSWVIFGWTTRRAFFDVSECAGKIMLQDETLWIWDVVTLPLFRGRGHYTEWLQEILQKHSKEKCIIYCDFRNVPSYRGIKKAGFEEWFSVNTWRFGRHIVMKNSNLGEMLYQPWSHTNK